MDDLRRFIPPFCPRSHCRYHRSAIGWEWVHFGSFSRQCAPQIIPRFRCCHCRSTFSTQTFSTTYSLKRPKLPEPVFHRLLACSGLRQITREARCVHSTVMGLAARLGRHALLFLTHPRTPGTITEPLVVDGFESFAYSQYHPLHVHLAIGANSHYVYGSTLSRLRRSGRMTAKQRRRRKPIEDQHGRPDPRAIELDMAAAVTI